VLAATILGSSMAFIDSTVVNVALPAIQSSFQATVVGVQWVVESYGLFLAALILTGGSLGDVLGRRRVFLIGVVVFAIASLSCGLAQSIEQLIIMRSVQGLGAALLVPGSLAIISACFDEKRRGAAIGTWSGFTAITTAIGPVLGGWLVQHASWRWAFLINLPIAAAVVGLSLWQVPESRGAADAPDWIGTLFATLGLGGLVAGLIESVSLGWKDPLVSGSLFVGFACLAVFLFIEDRTTSPIVPLRLFRSPLFSAANLLTLFVYAAIGIFFFLFPLNLIQVQGYSATAAGAAALPLILLMFTLSRWSGSLVTRYGPKLPLIVGPLVVALGFVLFAMPSATRGSYWTTFFPGVVVLGFGMAVTVAPLTTVVMNSAGPNNTGAASGINNAIARVAGLLAIALFGIVMASAFRSRLNHEMANWLLPPGIVQEIQANESKLAGLEVPVAVSPSTRAAITRMVGEAFVFGFRQVMLICAGLSAMGAAMAWMASAFEDFSSRWDIMSERRPGA
jgi:EmrB/QacA subfamily drug resistance transporter